MKKQEVNSAQEAIIMELPEIYLIGTQRVLVDKDLQEEALDDMLTGMQTLSWEGKALYAQELIRILTNVKGERKVIAMAGASLAHFQERYSA